MSVAAEYPSEEAGSTPVPAERSPLVVQWAQRHGVEVARRLADAEDFADQVQRRLRSANTTDTYAKAWKVWTRFCAAQGFPELDATRGALVAFVVWLLDRGRVDGKGYAPSSASTILAGAVVELRRRGATVGRDDQAQARSTLEAAAVELLKAGERRGRGQAAAAEVPDLYRVARACPDTLAGTRDKALVLTGFHYASRAQDPAGLLAGDVALTPRGLVGSVLTGKTKHSVRDAKINYQQDPEICPVEAWKAYRARLAADAEPRWSEPDAPAFVGVDRHGNVTGGHGPRLRHPGREADQRPRRNPARLDRPLPAHRPGDHRPQEGQGRRGDCRPGRLGPALPLHERLLPAGRRLGGQRHRRPHLTAGRRPERPLTQATH
ncbi:integrase [Streptomyces sp. enrichment culture]|uniref:integrase n=1 Tax=Streptomyces sp. enrichment culture TaxID=1795815 RepID=UPI003F57130B